MDCYKAILVIPPPPILLVVWIRQHLTHLCGHSWLLPKPIRLCGVSPLPTSPSLCSAPSRGLVKLTPKQTLCIFFWDLIQSVLRSLTFSLTAYSLLMSKMSLTELICCTITWRWSQLSQQEGSRCEGCEPSTSHTHVAKDWTVFTWGSEITLPLKIMLI